MADKDPVQNFIHQLDYGREEIRRFTQGRHRVRYVRSCSQNVATTFIGAEIIRSDRCRAGYVVGDRFVMDLDGGLVLERCTGRLCAHLITQFAMPVALICERLSEGLEPEDFHFRRIVRCGNGCIECVPGSHALAQIHMAKW